MSENINITEGAYELNQQPNWLITETQLINLKHIIKIELVTTLEKTSRVRVTSLNDTIFFIKSTKPLETFQSIQKLLSGQSE